MIKIYSISIIMDKMFFLAAALVLLGANSVGFKWFVIAYVIGKICSTIYLVVMAREIVVAKVIGIKETFKLIKNNIKIGINLMFSNTVGALILGVGRLVIENQWGLTAFGKISFSLALAFQSRYSQRSQ